MKLRSILFILIVIFEFKTISLQGQSRKLGDSLQIQFLGPRKVVANSDKDLWYCIVVTNISNRPVNFYDDIFYGRAPTPFANFDVLLYKKQKNKYVRQLNYPTSPVMASAFDSLYPTYGDRTFSYLDGYDFKKGQLDISESDTLRTNVLRLNSDLLPGDYRFKMALRVNTKLKGRNLDDPHYKIIYSYSDWFYFTVPEALHGTSRIQ